MPVTIVRRLALQPIDSRRKSTKFLTPSRKKPIRPSTGSPLRKRTESPRTHYLVADFTKEEKKRILDYCLKHKKSVSEFLADVALADAMKSHNREEHDEIRLKLPAEKTKKLAVLARLEDKSLNELIQELIVKATDARKQPASKLETQNLSYYLSEKEHRMVKDHVSKKGVSARNYIATLALETISKEQKKQK